MITQLHNFTSIAIDRVGNTFTVSLAGEPVGTFQLLPVWFLDDIHKGLNLGLTSADRCYVANDCIFRADTPADMQRVAALLVQDYLLATAHWAMPNF
jgi:hypothetical protein